ncbi:MAG: formylmethanofuran dehydrogenase subunit A [Candidatus Helarchaeota archaeon]
MTSLLIKNGIVFDPINGIAGEKMDIAIKDGKIAEKPNGGKVIDVSGMVVMPGGVDIHSHIAGSKVNCGRFLRPEDHRKQGIKRGKNGITRSGTGYSVPSTWVTGYKYAVMGYTTVNEPATPPLKTRHTHEEFNDMPIIDKSCFPVFGNNWFVLDYVSEGNEDLLAGYIAWLLRATKGYAVKIVNPGGVENWAWGKNVHSIDDMVLHWEITPRQIVTSLAKANERLGLPHTIHVHGNNLGHPGVYKITKQFFEAVQGMTPHSNRKTVMHITHLHFNAYGGTGWKDFCSEAAELAEYVNTHGNISFDVGQAIFGDTTTMTGDGPWEYALQGIVSMSAWGTKGGFKWINGQVEAECGSGVVPYIFAPKNPVNAVQWAIGLELMLYMKDPWRVYMTTDHPNGGPFENYPTVISWLMNKHARKAMIEKCHAFATQRTTLGDLDREYTLEEICIVTRAGTAKCLGMTNKGHLGIGADGDVAIYNLKPGDNDPKNVAKAFSQAAYTIKDGVIVAKDGEIITAPMGKIIWNDVKLPEKIETAIIEDLKEKWSAYYSINFANYPVKEHELINSSPISIKAN